MQAPLREPHGQPRAGKNSCNLGVSLRRGFYFSGPISQVSGARRRSAGLLGWVPGSGSKLQNQVKGASNLPQPDSPLRQHTQRKDDSRDVSRVPDPADRFSGISFSCSWTTVLCCGYPASRRAGEELGYGRGDGYWRPQDVHEETDAQILGRK